MKLIFRNKSPRCLRLLNCDAGFVARVVFCRVFTRTPAPVHGVGGEIILAAKAERVTRLIRLGG